MEVYDSAWRACPSQDRLLALHWAATQTSDAVEVMTVELTALASSGDLEQLTARLRASMMILAGRADDLLEELNKPTGRMGFSVGDVLVPYLLVSGCAGPRHQEWLSTRLSGFLTTIDMVAIWGGFADFGLAVQNRQDEARPSLSKLFAEEISTQDDDDAVLSRRLDAALQLIEQEVDSIISGKMRGQYARAAELLVYCAEALTLANSTEAGIGLVQSWKIRYPCHSAFQRELKGIVERTPLLTGARIGSAS